MAGNHEPRQHPFRSFYKIFYNFLIINTTWMRIYVYTWDLINKYFIFNFKQIINFYLLKKSSSDEEILISKKCVKNRYFSHISLCAKFNRFFIILGGVHIYGQNRGFWRKFSISVKNTVFCRRFEFFAKRKI